MPQNPRWAEIQAHLARHSHLDTWEILHQFVPDPVERKAYLDEVTLGQSGKDLKSSYMPITRDFFVRTFDNIRFFSFETCHEYAQLNIGINKNAVPWVPLGFTENALYRLHPEFDGLLPHRESTRQSVPVPFLGVNTNVAPPTGTRRNQQLSEASMDSAESDDVGNNCFVAHQLGELMYMSRSEKNLHPSEEGDKYRDEDYWNQTGFFVVAQLSSSGIAERLYLVMDSFPQRDDGSRPLLDHDDWGYLPSEPLSKQFSCAKLKGPPFLLTGRSFDTPFALESVREDPVELVCVKKTNMGDRLIPETVHHESRNVQRRP
ncbi:hypothetical protein BKA81DRAFT_345772 [Phyllosticta paracitricarpa]